MTLPIVSSPTGKLDPFTLKIIEDVLKEHAVTEDHGSGFCCQVATRYTERYAAHKAAIAEERKTGRTEEAVLTVPQERYIRGLYRKCPGHLLSPKMREQADKVAKGEKISFEDAKALIDAMKSVVDGPFQGEDSKSVRLATPPMIGFLRSLLAQREHSYQVNVTSLDGMSFGEASALITELKKAPLKASEKKTSERYIPEEGIYVVGGEYYKVQRNKAQGDGRSRYAKKFVVESDGWIYVGQKPFTSLTEDKKISAAEAARFGELYGRCVRCSRDLTDEFSIAHGYGKVCASKMGF